MRCCRFKSAGPRDLACRQRAANRAQSLHARWAGDDRAHLPLRAARSAPSRDGAHRGLQARRRQAGPAFFARAVETPRRAFRRRRSTAPPAKPGPGAERTGHPAGARPSGAGGTQPPPLHTPPLRLREGCTLNSTWRGHGPRAEEAGPLLGPDRRARAGASGLKPRLGGVHTQLYAGPAREVGISGERGSPSWPSRGAWAATACVRSSVHETRGAPVFTRRGLGARTPAGPSARARPPARGRRARPVFPLARGYSGATGRARPRQRGGDRRPDAARHSPPAQTRPSAACRRRRARAAGRRGPDARRRWPSTETRCFPRGLVRELARRERVRLAPAPGPA